MSGTELVCAALAQRLERAGVPVVQAWTRAMVPALKGAAAVIGVEETSSSGAALWDYLGITYDEAARQTVERYGRRLRLRLYVDVYAPKGQAAACEDACQALEEALLEPLHAGVRAETVQRGELGADSASGYLKCRCTAECSAYFTASRAEESAVLTNFELKGVVS